MSKSMRLEREETNKTGRQKGQNFELDSVYVEICN